jgi:hypothetical protein
MHRLCLNSHNCCYGYKNVCLSRRWKADLVCFRSCIQTLASLTLLVAYKPDQAPVYLGCPESV